VVEPEPWVLAEPAAAPMAPPPVVEPPVVEPVVELPVVGSPVVEPPPVTSPVIVPPAPEPRRAERRLRRAVPVAPESPTVAVPAKTKGKKAAARPTSEVRRVRRVLRHIDIWSLFRFTTLLYLCMLVVFMTAAVGLWILASAAGAIPSIENFITQLFALKRFHFKAFQLFLATLGIGIIGVGVTSLMTVVIGVLYNLICDVVGGVEITVLEERANEVGGT
jgi:hypothetical protein